MPVKYRILLTFLASVLYACGGGGGGGDNGVHVDDTPPQEQGNSEQDDPEDTSTPASDDTTGEPGQTEPETTQPETKPDSPSSSIPEVEPETEATVTLDGSQDSISNVVGNTNQSKVEAYKAAFLSNASHTFARILNNSADDGIYYNVIDYGSDTYSQYRYNPATPEWNHLGDGAIPGSTRVNQDNPQLFLTANGLSSAIDMLILESSLSADILHPSFNFSRDIFPYSLDSELADFSTKVAALKADYEAQPLLSRFPERVSYDQKLLIELLEANVPLSFPEGSRVIVQATYYNAFMSVIYNVASAGYNKFAGQGNHADLAALMTFFQSNPNYLLASFPVRVYDDENNLSRQDIGLVTSSISIDGSFEYTTGLLGETCSPICEGRVTAVSLSGYTYYVASLDARHTYDSSLYAHQTALLPHEGDLLLGFYRPPDMNFIFLFNKIGAEYIRDQYAAHATSLLTP